MPIVDFAIITGLTEEFRVLRELFPNLKEEPDSGNNEQWYRGRIVAENGTSYEVVASFQTQKGPLGAHALTTNVIQRWDPAHIILVGIAGTFDKEVKLGHVIVSQQVFHYDPGKAVGSEIRYRPQGYPCSATLIRQCEAFFLEPRTYEAWQQSGSRSAHAKSAQLIGENATEGRKALDKHLPELHFGTVASGSLVIASKKLQEDLLRLHGQIIGTEMEGAGMMHAAFSARELPVSAIVIKGISDAADEQKENEDEKGYWRALAKENSVRAALTLIRRGRIRALQTDRFDIDLTRGSAGDFRRRIADPASGNISGLAFPTLILPKGPLTRLQINIEVFGSDEGREKQLEIIKGVFEYTTIEGKRLRETWEFDNDVPTLRSLAPEPVGLYVMVRGTTGRLRIMASSPAVERTKEWEVEH